MENNKEYYTPEIDELFVGYEYEVIMEGNPKTWVKMIVDSPRLDYLLNVKIFANGKVEYSIPECIRTKYLDKQDIIDLGWNYGNGVTKTLFPMFKIDDKTTLFIHLFKGSIKITKCHSYDDNFIQEVSFETIFDGVCKSKNELSKLMKDYLNIPI